MIMITTIIMRVITIMYIYILPLSGICVSISSSTDPIGILLPNVLWWIILIDSKGNSLLSFLVKSQCKPKWNFSFHIGDREFLKVVVCVLYSSYEILFPEPDLAWRKACIRGSALPYDNRWMNQRSYYIYEIHIGTSYEYDR